MLVDLNWYECNKILRLISDSHKDGNSYSGDEELEMKIKSHRLNIETEKKWQDLVGIPLIEKF